MRWNIIFLQHRSLWASLLFLQGVWGGCAHFQRAPTARPSPVVLFFSVGVNGQLAPCGCSEGMKGGIPKIASVVENAKASGWPVFYFDGGNALFPAKPSLEGAEPELKRRAEAVAQALKQMQATSVSEGKNDGLFGDTFRRSLNLPWQDLNSGQLFQLAGHAVAVVNASSLEWAQTLGNTMRQQGAEFVVALVQQPVRNLLGHSHPSVNILISSEALGLGDAEENLLVSQPSPVVQIQPRGQSLLRLDLHFQGEDLAAFQWKPTPESLGRERRALEERMEVLRKQVNEPSLPEITRRLRKQKLEELAARSQALTEALPPSNAAQNQFSVTFISIESQLPNQKDIQQVVEAYDRDVTSINLQRAREEQAPCPQAADGQPQFVGSETCRTCHLPAYELWTRTRHASAYSSLEKKEKQYHVECVGCHVTGYRKPGGVCRIDEVKNRASVGCESCHGPGSLHVESPLSDNTIDPAPSATVCESCHNQENSPHFEASKYLPEVLGPGHGGNR